jgi:hypothetical protein
MFLEMIILVPVPYRTINNVHYARGIQNGKIYATMSPRAVKAPSHLIRFA